MYIPHISLEFRVIYGNDSYSDFITGPSFDGTLLVSLPVLFLGIFAETDCFFSGESVMNNFK